MGQRRVRGNQPASIQCVVSVLGALGLTVAGAAPTNAPAPGMQWLVVSSPQLRAETTPPPSEIRKPEIGAASFSLSYRRDDAESDFNLRRRGLEFIQLPERVAGDPVSRGFESVLRPEEFKIGRSATFSCSVSTAIKRRNPLCLLNPIFLHVSW